MPGQNAVLAEALLKLKAVHESLARAACEVRMAIHMVEYQADQGKPNEPNETATDAWQGSLRTP